MAILNPDHLLDQAVRLSEVSAAGPPRQADLRRAISAAYYALFHALLAAGADEMVGRTRRADPRYGLAYRSVDHARLRELCMELKKPTPHARYARCLPETGLGRNIPAVATAFVELQDWRHAADYDPLLRVNKADALAAIRTARSAIRRFHLAKSMAKRTFLSLMMFSPRR